MFYTAKQNKISDISEFHCRLKFSSKRGSTAKVYYIYIHKENTILSKTQLTLSF